MGNCSMSTSVAPQHVHILVPTLTEVKVLLLGTGNSGKTTIFKRWITLNETLDEDTRKDYKESVIEHVIDSMQTLISQARLFHSETLDKHAEEVLIRLATLVDVELPLDIKKLICHYADQIDHFQICEKNWDAAGRIMEILDDPWWKLKGSVTKDIQTLWNDDAVKNTFQNRALFQISENADYFFDNVAEFLNDYIPSERDILHCRERTCGVSSSKDELDGYMFRVLDVGGGRTERKQWVRHFQELDFLVYVVALSEFDQLCFEDELTNRLDDSLSLFRLLVQSMHIGHKPNIPFMVVFNKMDLFRRKIEAGTHFDFELYEGPQNVDSISEFVCMKFREQTSFDFQVRYVSAVGPDFNVLEILKCAEINTAKTYPLYHSR